MTLQALCSLTATSKLPWFSSSRMLDPQIHPVFCQPTWKLSTLHPITSNTSSVAQVTSLFTPCLVLPQSNYSLGPEYCVPHCSQRKTHRPTWYRWVIEYRSILHKGYMIERTVMIRGLAEFLTILGVSLSGPWQLPLDYLSCVPAMIMSVGPTGRREPPFRTLWPFVCSDTGQQFENKVVFLHSFFKGPSIYTQVKKPQKGYLPGCCLHLCKLPSVQLTPSLAGKNSIYVFLC